MKFTSINDSYILRLETGEKLLESLTQFLKRNGINAGTLEGIGSCDEVTLGFYQLRSKAYEWRTIHEALEIVSLTGNIAIVDGEPFVHMHGVVSDSTFRTFGGHFKDAIVGATCEVVIRPFENVRLERNFDGATGLKLLTCEGQLEEK